MDMQPQDDREDLVWFETLSREDVPRVGGKNASLGEMVRTLAYRCDQSPMRLRVESRVPRAAGGKSAVPIIWRDERSINRAGNCRPLACRHPG